MNTLLQSLDQRTLGLMMLASAALVMTALASWVIWPEIREFRNSQDTLMVLEGVTNSGNALAQELVALQGTVKALDQQLHGDMVNMPENQLEAFIIGGLQGISWRNNVDLLSVKPGKGEAVQIFEEVLFDVVVAGDYFDLFVWLQELDDELGFVVVKNFNISQFVKPDGPQRVKARLTIVSYREATDA